MANASSEISAHCGTQSAFLLSLSCSDLRLFGEFDSSELGFFVAQTVASQTEIFCSQKKTEPTHESAKSQLLHVMINCRRTLNKRNIQREFHGVRREKGLFGAPAF